MPKVEYTFDPFSKSDIKLTQDQKEMALEFIADLVKEQVLIGIGNYVSPVTGKPFPKYNKDYADEKNVSPGEVNLEFSGEMLDALQTEVKGNKIRIFVEGDQAGKAEGNNIGSYGQSEANPKKARRFIPLKGETWNDEIWNQIDNAIFGLADDGE